MIVDESSSVYHMKKEVYHIYYHVWLGYVLELISESLLTFADFCAEDILNKKLLWGNEGTWLHKLGRR